MARGTRREQIQVISLADLTLSDRPNVMEVWIEFGGRLLFGDRRSVVKSEIRMKWKWAFTEEGMPSDAFTHGPAGPGPRGPKKILNLGGPSKFLENLRILPCGVASIERS